MHNFTRATWTEEDSQRMRERLRQLSDTALRQVLAAVEYMCSPKASWAKDPREECFIIQRELVLEEVRKRDRKS